MYRLYEQVIHKSKNNLPMRIYKTSGVYLHWHEEYEFILPIGGSAFCVINGERTEIKENNAILLQSGVLHLIQPNSNVSIIAIVVSPSFWADKTVSDLFGGQISFQEIFNHSNPIDAKVIEILKHTVKIYDEECFGYEYIMKANFSELFSILLQNGRYSKTTKLSKEYPAAFKKLINYVHEHYPDKISLDILSDISFYSKTYIINLFKKYTNLTPSEYITQYRLTKAKRMLETENINNLDIAIACGFNSESYFIYVFKKSHGITPKEYRSKTRYKH